MRSTMQSIPQYTVASRGRPIGLTDLGFARLGGPGRSGWFHPNTHGERLMPTLASPLPAMRAYLHRDVLGPNGEPLVHPDLPRSTLFADLAEALHHAGALELTLHRPDGSLVPTTTVGIQDTDPLLPPAEEDVQLAPGAQLEFPTFDAPRDRRWTPDGPAPTFPRYQIHVALADPGAIP